jgi:hypothetical protein
MRAALLAIALGAPACAEPPTPTFAEVQTAALATSCAFSSCHGAAQGTGGLKLDGTDADYERLVGVASSTGEPLVDPSHADGSYLVAKLEGAAGITGDAMPPGSPLDDAALQLVRDWIDGGAPR